MSAVENYIIINGEQLSKEMKAFAKDKIQKQFEKSKDLLKNKLKEHFKPQIQKYLKIKSDKEFFKLLEDIRTNVIEKQADLMNSQLVAGFSYSDINSIFSSKTEESISMDLQKLQDAIDEWKKLLKHAGEPSFQKQITAYLQTSDFISAINESKLDVDQAKELSRKFYLGGSNYSFTINEDFDRSVNMQMKNIETSHANLAVLQQLVNELKSSSQGLVPVSVSNKVSEFTKNFLFSTFFTIGKILGFLSEDFLANSLSFQEFVTDEMAGPLLKNKKITISGSTSGTSSSDMFKVATTDIKLDLNISKKTGTISINLPGVSLKRSRSPQGHGRINLKSSAKLGNIINNVFADSQTLYTFYSAMANYRRSSESHYIYNDKNQMQDMYSYMKASMFPWAAAGSLTKEDFAYFFVINGKAYTVLNLLENIGASGFANSVDLSFDPTQQQIARDYGQFLLEDKKYIADKQIKEKINGINYNYQLMRNIGI